MILTHLKFLDKHRREHNKTVWRIEEASPTPFKNSKFCIKNFLLTLSKPASDANERNCVKFNGRVPRMSPLAYRWVKKGENLEPWEPSFQILGA